MLATEEPVPVRATVTNLDVPFWQMVWLLIKVSVAAIPAAIILTLAVVFVSGTLFTASCRHLMAPQTQAERDTMPSWAR